MPKEITPTVTERPVLPTVSVADAFGLPEKRNFAEDLGVVKGNPAELATHVEPEKPAEKPDAVVTEDPPAPGDEKPVVPDKPAAEVKPVVPPKVEPKPEEKPAAAVVPVVAPEKKEVVVPAVPAAPIKIKIGDKEYTEAELAAKLKEAEKPAAPVEPPKPAKTADEIKAEDAARETARVADETRWKNEIAQEMAIPVDEASVNAILEGGPGAVAALQGVLKRGMAEVMLLARKSIYKDINPVMQSIMDAQQPLVEAYQRQAADTAWTEFSAENPDLAPHRQVVDVVASTLHSKFKSEIDKLDKAGYRARLATDTRALQAEIRKLGGSPEAPVAPAVPAAAAVVPAAPVVPVATVKAKTPVKPPGANSPAAPAAGAGKKGGDSDIIKGMGF